MLKRISIKHALAVLVGLLILCGLLLELETRISANQREGIQEKWLNFETQRSEKARLYTSLLANVGYGGFIHNYKNFILRKRPAYANAAHNDLGAVRAVIAQYLAVQTEQEELIALHDLGNTLAEYQQALVRIESMVQEGDHVTDSAELDDAVDVDDEFAFRAIETLDRVIEREIGSGDVIGKPRLAIQLRRAIGYGGFIHNYKNFILRGDQQFSNRAKQGLSVARRVLREWQAFPTSHAENLAIQDIEAVLTKYGVNLEDAEKMVENGATTEEIDKAVVVDDYPATRGLAVLDREIALSIVREFKEVEEQFNFAAQLAVLRDWSTRLVILFLLLATGVLTYFMVIRPLKRIETVMSDLAAGDLSVEIPGIDAQNEVGHMARAIGVFKETAIRLQESNEELEVTVSELTATKSRLEEQASDLAAMAETLEVERQRAEKLSITDRLTGLNNRQKLDQVIADELDRAKRYDHPLSVIMFDVDHFKSVNDTHGHLVGDEVLIKLAETVTKTIRSVDICGRWGGEEFIVICPETAEAGCAEVAEKIRKAIEKTDFPVVGTKTASFGIAEYRKGESADAIIHRADQALYGAKQLGRNRVELSA
ncbi:GGDEF domain-containing protein [Hwanghaeella sp.]|uniref:GGDEF domain-containing protein n=1 Tax=Hwanghaeella sp. TaxID=2605943 RepID=UPI003CCC204B